MTPSAEESMLVFQKAKPIRFPTDKPAWVPSQTIHCPSDRLRAFCIQLMGVDRSSSSGHLFPPQDALASNSSLLSEVSTSAYQKDSCRRPSCTPNTKRFSSPPIAGLRKGLDLLKDPSFHTGLNENRYQGSRIWSCVEVAVVARRLPRYSSQPLRKPLAWNMKGCASAFLSHCL